MEKDLEILQNIIQYEYNNNKNIQFGDISVYKDDNNTFYFYYSVPPDKQEDEKITEIALCKMDLVLDLIVRKMHGSLDNTPCSILYLELVNDIYEHIYNLYKDYIKEKNYYI